MEVKLYRLFAVQDFGKKAEGVQGKVAVYVGAGPHPDPEILNDAQEISRGVTGPAIVCKNKPWLYTVATPRKYDSSVDKNIAKLRNFTRMFYASQKIIQKHPNTHYAIFVESINQKDWHGEKTLYFTKYLDEVKSDTPTFSGCEEIRTIKL